MARLMRFGFVGFANTLLGYCLILSALQLGFDDYTANAIGYLAGMIMGYFLNKRFVFQDNVSTDNGAFFRYALAVIFSYSVNLIIVSAGISLGMSGSALVHLVAMICYSGTLFSLSNSFVFTSSSQSDLQTYDVLSVVGLLTLPALFLFYAIPVSHDVYWQYWIARQMNHGVELYTQINEVNPPLWFWMALPVQEFADYSNLSAIHLNNVLHVLLTSLVAVISAYLLPKEIQLSGGIKLNRAVFAAMIMVCAFCVATQNFAQREHFAMLVALPYAMLIYRRAMNMPTRFWVALSIGILAATGFAMKHYLVAVPIILELFLLYRRRNILGAFRPETIALAVCTMGYVAAILWFTPDFLKLQLPIVLAFYNDFAINPSLPIVSLFKNLEAKVWLWIFLLFLYERWNPFGKSQVFQKVLFLTASGFLLAYLLQNKGFSYHAIPVSFFIFLLFATFLYAGKLKPRNLQQKAVMGGILFIIFLVYMPIGIFTNKYTGFFESAVKQTPKGSSVYVLTLKPRRIWPMIEKMEYQWPSSFISFWTYNGMQLSETKSAENQELSDNVKAKMVQDLKCHPPKVFLVSQKTSINRYAGYKDLNILEYFLSYKPAADLFENYSFSHKTELEKYSEYNFDVYTLNDNHTIKPSDPASCRTIY